MAEVKNILTMKFRTADNKTRLVTLQPCKASLTDTNVKAVMDSMITSGAFVYEPAAKLGATLTHSMISELF